MSNELPLSEAKIQSSCVIWLWNTYPETRGMFFSVTNDGAKLSVRIIREAMERIIKTPSCAVTTAIKILSYCISGDGIGGAIRRALGVVPGVSDCLFIWRGSLYCFEFKTLKGHQSPAQIEWQDKVNKQHIQYYVVRSLDQFQTLIKELI